MKNAGIKTWLGCAAIVLAAPVCHAATAPYNVLTAPDAVSRAVLARPVTRFEEGATSKDDVAAAIHRNFPQIVEQNFAGMNTRDAIAFVDQLSDIELAHLAQLYVNANADSHRQGRLLLVTASRLDGAHLGRLSRFFGYSPVYDAILQASPVKAQSFAQSASIAYAAPVAGASVVTAAALAAGAGPSVAEEAALGGGRGPVANGSPFKPNVGMTLDEIYTGFRGMVTGRMAVTAALYETGQYASLQLAAAWGIGYGFGTGLTYLAQTYAPDWYSDTFVPAVGNTVTWVQNWVVTAASLATTSVMSLGAYQQNTAPTLGVPLVAQQSMQNTGGDFSVTAAWNTYYLNSSDSCPRGQKCPPPMER